MKTSVLFFGIATAVALVIVGSCYPNWAPQECRPVGPASAPTRPQDLQWFRNPDHQQWSYLYAGERCVGGYNWDTGFYYPYRAGQWHEKAIAPISPPFGQPAGAGHGSMFGVDAERRSETPRTWGAVGGMTVADAANLFAAELADDSKDRHVTVVAKDPAVRSKVKTDLAQAVELTNFKKAARVQVYDPAAKPTGPILAPYQLERDPEYLKSGVAVIAQAVGDGPAGTSKPAVSYAYGRPQDLVDALRKVDPNFDPKKPFDPVLPSLPTIGEDSMLILIVLGVILLFFVLSRKQD